jgi:hypothetical protein
MQRQIIFALLVLSPTLLATACDSDDEGASSPRTRTRPDARTTGTDTQGPVEGDTTAIGTASDGGARDAAEPSDGLPDDDAGTHRHPPVAGSGAPGMNTSSDGTKSEDKPVTCPEDAPRPVDRVRLTPISGQAMRILGARIQGSNAGPTTDFVDLATITEAPADGEVLDLQLSNTQLYRYVRYYAPPQSDGGVAQLEFYSGMVRVDGESFGTATPDPWHTYQFAFDGDPSTYFAPIAEGGGYVGVDIARGHVTQTVSFEPGATASATPIEVKLTSGTSDATIRYTIDGSDPIALGAMTYDTPVQISMGRTTIRAAAFSQCRFTSAVTSATYSIGQAPVAKGLKTYHVGNSLTDVINPWLEPIAESTGVDHIYARWTIPGAPIKWLEEHQGQGFEDPQTASQFDNFVRTNAPIDHLSIQPFSDPDFTTQGGSAVRLLTTALTANPDIQFWVYAQWPGRTQWMTDAMSNGGGMLYPEWQVPAPPENWEQATQNQSLYFEAFRDYVDSRVEGKPILIVPGGLALVALKREMDAGNLPGLSNFFGTMFEDEQHLTKPAQYLISLVFYSCLYRQSPEGRVMSEDTGLTPEQARIFQGIAWNTAVSYPSCGISQ